MITKKKKKRQSNKIKPKQTKNSTTEISPFLWGPALIQAVVTIAKSHLNPENLNLHI